MPKDQIQSQEDTIPLAGENFPFLNLLRWLGILETLIFGVATIWFFITAHSGVSGLRVRDNPVGLV
jgi:hypothetical protein